MVQRISINAPGPVFIAGKLPEGRTVRGVRWRSHEGTREAGVHAHTSAGSYLVAGDCRAPGIIEVIAE